MSSAKVALIAAIGVAVAAASAALTYRARLQKECQNRADERRGRINAERKLAEAKEPRPTSSPNGTIHNFSTYAIGTVQSVYSKRFGTPRQPGLVEAPTAIIRLNPALSNCLTDLDQYSHVWVLYWFHKNTNQAKTLQEARPFDSIKSLINIPRHDFKVGVFACRSPHRPNPIGLSLARIVSVDKVNGTVKLAGLDAVDGSPVLDLKPYLPGVENQKARVPDWVSEGYSEATNISSGLLVQWRCPREVLKIPSAFSWLSEEELLRVIEETLSQGDLRSRHQRELSEGSWKGVLEICGLIVDYTQRGCGIEIASVGEPEDVREVSTHVELNSILRESHVRERDIA